MTGTAKVHSGTMTTAVASQLVEKQESHSSHTVGCGCRKFSRASKMLCQGYELKSLCPGLYRYLLT